MPTGYTASVADGTITTLRAATRTAWVRELRASLPRMHKTP